MVPCSTSITSRAGRARSRRTPRAGRRRWRARSPRRWRRPSWCARRPSASRKTMSVKVPPMSTATRKRCGPMVAVILLTRYAVGQRSLPERASSRQRAGATQAWPRTEHQPPSYRPCASACASIVLAGRIDDPVVGHRVPRVELQLPLPVDRAGRRGDDLDHQRRRALDATFVQRSIVGPTRRTRCRAERR